MPDILISENLNGVAIEQLCKTFDVAVEPELWKHPAQLMNQVARARALIVRNQTKVTTELIRAGTNLQVIGRAGVGVENIDTTAANKAGVVVCYAPEQNCVSVAELTWGLILALARKIPAADRSTRHGKWDRHDYMGVELSRKTLGVIGLGRIGFLTAMRGKAFGMEIAAFDPIADPGGMMVNECGAKLMSLPELLHQADIITCHVPETPRTIGLIDEAALRHMKPSALLVNTSRGKVIDEVALIRALHERRIAGAALDVRETEPPSSGELNSMPNVILTPHIAAFTHESQERVLSAVCHDVASVLNGRAPRYPFNVTAPGAVQKGASV